MSINRHIASLPFILEHIYRASPQMIGIVFGVNALGIVIIAQVSARPARTVSPRTLLTWGATMCTLGGLALLAGVLGGIGLISVLAALFVVIASLGLIAPNATTLALAIAAFGSATLITLIVTTFRYQRRFR